MEIQQVTQLMGQIFITFIICSLVFFIILTAINIFETKDTVDKILKNQKSKKKHSKKLK